MYIFFRGGIVEKVVIIKLDYCAITSIMDLEHIRIFGNYRHFKSDILSQFSSSQRFLASKPYFTEFSKKFSNFCNIKLSNDISQL